VVPLQGAAGPGASGFPGRHSGGKPQPGSHPSRQERSAPHGGFLPQAHGQRPGAGDPGASGGAGHYGPQAPGGKAAPVAAGRGSKPGGHSGGHGGLGSGIREPGLRGAHWLQLCRHAAGHPQPALVRQGFSLRPGRGTASGGWGQGMGRGGALPAPGWPHGLDPAAGLPGAG